MSFSPLDSHLLGPLFAAPDMRRVFADAAFLEAMLRVEAALAHAQAQHGMAPEALSGAIAAMGADTFDLAALGAATARAGVLAIPFVQAVQKRLPPELEPHFHKGATTQDIHDTAIALQMQAGLALIERDVAAIVGGFARLAREHAQTPCVGRTYGQHAAPITFGLKAAGWAFGVAEAGAHVRTVGARAMAATLGGPVGSLAAMGDKGEAVKAAFAAGLGLHASPITQHTLRHGVAALGCALALLIGALAKMAADVASLASTEIGEAAEPHQPGRGASSAMPHKRNPVGASLILAAHAAAPGLAATMLTAMAAEHERPPGLWHAEWLALPPLFGLASGALREARGLAEGLRVDPARMRANLDLTRGLLFADAVAARLAPAMGREAAHHAIEAAAERVRATGRPLAEILALDPPCAGADALIAQAFDPAPATAAAARMALAGAQAAEQALA